MKKFYLPVLIISLISLFSCKDKNDYSAIIDSNLSGEELFQAIYIYEKENTQDFCSKVDLANYYMLQGDYDTAYEYLVRATSVLKNCPKGKKGKQYKTLLYGMKAQIELYSGLLEQALSNVNLTIEQDKKQNNNYNYLKAHIYFAQGDESAALDLFDKTYNEIPEKITKEDEQTYLYLLAKAERFTDARNMLEKFFIDGEYFNGLGAFASAIYEETKDYGKAILAAYLDYEYNSCFYGYNNEQFEENIDNVVMSFLSGEALLQTTDIVKLLKSRIKGNYSYNFDYDFYVAKYINLLNKIDNESFSIDDVQDFLDLEIYFNLFPSYYWYAWKGFSLVQPAALKDYIPLLNKVILLGQNIFSYSARLELGKIIDLPEEYAQKILLAQEVNQILSSFLTTLDVSLLEPIFDLLDSPENTYELNALVLLKNNITNTALYNEINKKAVSASGRLKERLYYILQ